MCYDGVHSVSMGSGRSISAYAVSLPRSSTRTRPTRSTRMAGERARLLRSIFDAARHAIEPAGSGMPSPQQGRRTLSGWESS